MAPGVIGIVRAPAKRAESIVAGGEGGSLTPDPARCSAPNAKSATPRSLQRLNTPTASASRPTRPFMLSAMADDCSTSAAFCCVIWPSIENATLT
jgi:hypothetical protein